MASVHELSAPLSNVLLGPRHGPGVCRTCFNLIDGHDRCYACTRGGDVLDVMAPISYSIGGEQLHHALASYKHPWLSWSRSVSHQLAAILWRHLESHEACLARASALASTSFPLVTTVPSGRADGLDPHPLQTMVGELVGCTKQRHRPLLACTNHQLPLHEFDPDRFSATCPLDGEPVLLIDDTWTTGAHAQGAAAALKRAGAGPVTALVIGRFLNRDYRDNDRRLNAIQTPFEWARCPWCAAAVRQV
jgi:hypothetical protein